VDIDLANSLKKILFDPMVGKAVTLFFGIALILGLSKFLRSAARKRISDDENRYRAAKLVSFASYFMIIFFVTIVFSSKLGGLTTAFGVAGAGVAFALQEVIASVAGWIAISAGGFFKTGDRVQLGGIKGDVIDISVLRTTVMELGQWVDADLYNGRIVKIANSYVFKEPVFNYSSDFPFLWDEIKIPIRYGSDLALADRMLQEIAGEIVGDYGVQAAASWHEVAKKYLVENANTEPMVTMVANDNWCEFTLRYTVDYRKRRTTKSALFRRIVEAIDRSERKIQLASATSEIVAVPRIEVDLAPPPA
jgi:small-conductance mechanosensitive channel